MQNINVYYLHKFSNYDYISNDLYLSQITMTEPTESSEQALVVTEAVNSTVTVVEDINPLKQVQSKAVKLAIVAALMLFGIFSFGSLTDMAFPRTVDVRSYNWSVASEGTTSKQLLSDEGTPRGDFYLTALVPNGTQITGRVDQSLPRFFTQRKITFGNLKSSAALADELGCRIITLKISGLTISTPFLKTYPVIRDVVTSKHCKA
jgi:hypothetical protein